MRYNVFTREESVWARGMIHDYLDAIERGLPQHPLPKSAAEWEAVRVRTREKLLDSLGIVPSQTCDLDARIVGVAEREGYRLERVVFYSRPDCPVTANVYVPKRAEFPAPAVLCPHGHAAEGKAYSLYQHHYVGLVKKGFVVMSFDMIGYNERAAMGHRQMFAPYLAGGSLIGMILWDGMKALDYLCSRPEVDTRRIGCTGNSGGGKQTLFLSALDERIAVSAPAGHGATYAYTAQKERDICACNTVPGFLRFAEMDYVFGLIAPRPLLMVMGLDDRLFPFDLVRKVFRRVRRIYRLLGVEDRVELSLSNCGHGYDLPKREAMYAWFNRHLKGIDDLAKAKEPRIRPEKAGSKAISCFPNGKVPADAATTNQLVLREGEAVLAQARARLSQKGGKERARRRLGKLLWPQGVPRGRVMAEARGTTQAAKSQTEKLLLHTEPGVVVPCVLHAPGSGRRKVVILVDDAGKSSPRGRVVARKMVSRGFTVAAVDPRGWGETTGRELSEDGAIDEHYASQRALIFGRPLMGMRALDLVRTRDYVKQRWPSSTVGLYGIGLGALVGCLAVAAVGGFDSLTCEDLPLSFLPPSEAETPYPLSFYVYDILQVGDVRDLLALVGRRKSTVVSGRDADGRRLRARADCVLGPGGR